MSTSKLQIYMGDLLDKNFPQFRIRENYRPDWLISSEGTKLELDFYIEELNIGIEVQGMQHYQFVEFFHKTQNEFEKRKKFDNEKKDLCYGCGCKFVEIITEKDADIFVKIILDKLKIQPNYLYQDKTQNRNKNKHSSKTFTKSETDKQKEKCKIKLDKFLRGEITATPEKVRVWKHMLSEK